MNKSRTKPLIPLHHALSAGRSQGGAELRGFIGGLERSPIATNPTYVVPANAGTHNHRCRLLTSRLAPALNRGCGAAMSAIALTLGARLKAGTTSMRDLTPRP